MDMNAGAFIRISGLVAIFAGILNILSTMPEQIPESALPWVHRVGDISALIALTDIYLNHRKFTHTFGLIAFIVAVAGVLMLIFSLRYEQAIMVYALGVILMAISHLRTRGIPIWVPLLWLVSVLIALPGFLIPSLGTITSLLAAMAFGLGFVEAGYYLITIRPVYPN
jgi:membrane-bound metal-dependent hydrolase YbcI (DUF457 family)